VQGERSERGQLHSEIVEPVALPAAAHCYRDDQDRGESEKTRASPRGDCAALSGVAVVGKERWTEYGHLRKNARYRRTVRPIPDAGEPQGPGGWLQAPGDWFSASSMMVSESSSIRR
jgi:hypothetical protein